MGNILDNTALGLEEIFTQEEANELGAFVENALDVEDATNATEMEG